MDISYLGVGNGNLNFHTRFDWERGDLLNDLSWALQVNDAFVDSHLEPNERNPFKICYYSLDKTTVKETNLSQVFDPSPQGVLRVVILNVLVGIRTGPFTRRFLSLAAPTSSEHTERVKFDKSTVSISSEKESCNTLFQRGYIARS